MNTEAEYTLLERCLGREAAARLWLGRARPEEIGEIKPSVVLFADICHFSRLTEQLPLNDLRRFLSDFFQLFVTMVEEQGGFVNKFAGDGGLALFAAAPENVCAMAAVTAGLNLQARFHQLRAQWQELAPPCAQVDLAVGISYGEVFLGTVGAAARFEYTAIGTAVNVAQRLAADAGTGGVYCCGAVQKRLHKSVRLAALGTVQPRGMGHALSLFQVPAKG
ncbi:MAG: adenylate/guanylate cyclase domain-containing protein [bacterium]|nr:adenylate/guanylate cyclase domain-containing protein [bacterium]